MNENYESLIEKVADRYGKQAFSAFNIGAARRGSEYIRHGWRLLFIERESSVALPLQSIFNSNDEYVDESGILQMKCMHRHPKWLLNVDSASSRRDGIGMNSYAGELWRRLEDKYSSYPVDKGNYGNLWYEWTAWTSLYKISESNRPLGISMARILASQCREILKDEIDVYRPSLIVMEQDSSWFSSFSSLFSSIEVRCGNIVKVTAYYRGIPVIVVANPVYAGMEEIVSAIESAADYLYVK